MSKLFILGNGFDLAHKLPTRYIHFRDFLVGQVDKSNYDLIDFFEFASGKFNLNPDLFIAMLINLIDDSTLGENWEDFEESTANFYYERFFDFCVDNEEEPVRPSSIFFDINMEDYPDLNETDLEPEEIDEMDLVLEEFEEMDLTSEEIDEIKHEFNPFGIDEEEDEEETLDVIPLDGMPLDFQEIEIANQLNGCMSELKILFSKWFNTIDTTNVKKTSFINFIADNDMFLTFNYTNTLESVYSIREKNICHIHGQLGEDIIFGHGQEENPYEKDEITQLYHDEAYSGTVYEVLSGLFESFKKNTQGCYEKHKCFFEKLSRIKIDSIISIGFSFSEVDRFYIKKICEAIDTSNVVWHQTLFDKISGKKEVFEQIIKECGFKGSFGELIPDLEADRDFTAEKKVS